MGKTVVEKVIKALIDSGEFSEVEAERIVGVGVPEKVYAYDDTNGVSVTIRVKSAA